MIIDSIKDAILQNIGPLKQAPKGWHKRNCPLCHTQGHSKDSRNRFGIQFNTLSVAVNCFNCGFSAGYTEGEGISNSFSFLLRHLNIDDNFIKHIEFEIFKQKNQISIVRDGDDETQESREQRFKSLFQKWKPMDLPGDSYTVTQWLESGCDDPNFLRVVDYAISRKIYDLDHFYWSPSTQHNVNQRLTIPYLYRGKIVGFTSRLCYDTDGKKIPKYYQQCPTDFVYNLDSQQDWTRKYTILTEGVLDAWTVDGISILGEVGQVKVDIVNRLQKEIIVCPDMDRKGQDLVSVAIDNGWSVAFPKWGPNIKDASKAAEKYGKLLTAYSIISSSVSGSTSIKVMWDLYQNQRNKIVKYE